ncbi:hypothetical protein DFJ58DRAFT_865666 [Suillus subalutaceus]|uniref:uncharacterized protein n=1 Tax=Suillus subalutaceus TaxID=48586 RepID=UPI001B86E124|nr:uncharacterized protein DFJ58DRAFT_865666 [Suillus subalutaceus]KAG1876508.1 hypothetical protein DFJ58DRAFT_865666 [Suillus subalutaceus]
MATSASFHGVVGLQNGSSLTDSVNVAEKLKEEIKEESPKVHAARLGMYDVMTREVCTWQPARLLCERFGVKDPVLEILVDTSGLSTQTARPEFTSIALADEFAGARAGAMQVESGGSRSSKHDVANIGMGEDDGRGDDVLTYERPGLDIVEANFTSDDEESDEEKDYIDNVDEVDEPPAV